MKSFYAAVLVAMAVIAVPCKVFSQTIVQDSGAEERLDHRIYLHYSEAQIQDMEQNHPAKIQVLTYYYRHSFYVKANPLCPNCPAIDVETFDVEEYEHLRQPTREYTFELGQPGHYIVLKPRQALQAAYATFQ